MNKTTHTIASPGRRLGFGIAVSIALAFALAFGAPSIAQTTISSTTPKPSAHAGHANPKVKFATSLGDFVVELNHEAAPKTVDNIVQYVKDKHYDGTVFHRVIPTFMIQGGGMDANMVERKTRAPVVHEGQNSLAKGLKNVRGSLAMARTNDPNSGTAQFFVNTVDNAFLDPVALPDGDPVTFNFRGQSVTAPRAQVMASVAGYTVFGKVISGMDVVDKIKDVPTGNKPPHQNVPTTAVTIIKASLEK